MPAESSMNKEMEIACLEHLLAIKTWTKPAAVFGALLTALPTAATKGTEFTEANYTGYTAKIAVTEWEAITGSNPAVITHKAAIKFGTRSAGESTIKAVGFTTEEALVKGQALFWAKVTEFTVNATNKEPEIAAKALEIKLS